MLFSKKLKTLTVAGAAAVLASLLFLTTGVAFAHGHTTVGDYELVIGFHNEPAYAGEPNGLDLFVTNTKTNEMVNGLEKTLKVEIVRGSHKKTLTMEAQWGQDGAYTAYVVPAEAGDYTWHIWGDIEGTPVDVSMTSSPETFSTVEDKLDVSFPAPDSASSSSSQPDTALYVAIAGVVLGLAGIVLAIVRTRPA